MLHTNCCSDHCRLGTLQTRALLCTNNMLSTLPIENLGGMTGLFKIWTEAGKLAFNQNENNENLLESATAVMRAALDKMKMNEDGNTSDGRLFKDLRLEDLVVSLFTVTI